MTQLACLANGVIVEFFPHGDPVVPGLALVPVPDEAVIGGTVDSSGNYAPPAAPDFSGMNELEAQSLLDASDKTIMRCAENSVAVPAVWAAYRAALRSIRTGGIVPSSGWPVKPGFPAGT